LNENEEFLEKIKEKVNELLILNGITEIEEWNKYYL
jgi:hypothetical protein